MEKRENSGALFTNDKREKETHPHYNGKATINGVDYYVSSWIKEGKKGTSEANRKTAIRKRI
jgi:hypothetical protein